MSRKLSTTDLDALSGFITAVQEAEVEWGVTVGGEGLFVTTGDHVYEIERVFPNGEVLDDSYLAVSV